MADLRYIRPNQLRRRANRVRILVVVLGVPGTLILGLIHILLMLPAAIALSAIWNRQSRFLKGAQGEDMALGVPIARAGSLSTLSDDYIVFNQLQIPRRDATIELDHVVVGPNGVFDIECKHMVGEIVGNDTDRKWIQHKRGSGGMPITQEARNPVIQVRRSAHALATYLRSKGIDVWVHAIVVFTHPKVKLSVSSNSVPILMLPQLANHITSFRPLVPFRQQGAVMQALKLLRDNKPTNDNTATAIAGTVLGSGAPRHISYFMKDFVQNRVDTFMKQNLTDARKAVLRQEKQTAPASPPSLQVASPATRKTGIVRRPRLTVIRGGATGIAKRRHTRVRTVLKCVETVQTEEIEETECPF